MTLSVFHSSQKPSSQLLGWKTTKVKYLGQYINGYPFKPEDWSDNGKPIIRIQNLSNSDAEFNHYEHEIPKIYLIQKGDILISWSASLGVYRWTGQDAWLNQHIFKVFINEKIVDRRYYFWLASWFMKELEERVHGSTMQHLTFDAFGSFQVLIPELTQQHNIADYLERETEYIDALLDSKQLLLQLLIEKRQALISHAVTQGLNSNIPFRNTGLPWLGEIPNHWELEYAHWLFNEIDYRSETGNEELLSVSHLTGVTPRSEKDVNMFMAETNEGYKVCQSGDLVINTLWAWMGAMGVAFMHGIVSPAYNVYRQTGRHNPRYLDYLVRIPNFAKEATRYSKGVWSSRLRLYPEEFFLIQMPVPPLDEQQVIIDYLDREISKINKLLELTQSSIALLSEKRAALISAAVTGQIEIPEALCN